MFLRQSILGLNKVPVFDREEGQSKGLLFDQRIPTGIETEPVPTQPLQRLSYAIENPVRKDPFVSTLPSRVKHQRYLLVLKVIAFIVICNLLVSATIYEYVAVYRRLVYANDVPVYVLSICSSVLSFFLFLLNFLRISALQSRERATLRAKKQTSSVQSYGLCWTLLTSLSLFVHPIYPSIGDFTRVEDSYYNNQGISEQFRRSTAEYLILLQFIFCLCFLIYVISEHLNFSDPQGHRMMEYSGLTPCFTKIAKFQLKRFPVSSFLTLVFICIFSVAYTVRISNTGAVLPITDNPHPENVTYASLELQNRTLLYRYGNSYWMTFQAFHTIGDKELAPRTGLARFFTLFGVWGGFSMITLAIALFANALKLAKAQEKGFRVVQKMLRRKELKSKAKPVLFYFAKLVRAKRLQKMTNIENINLYLDDSLKEFAAERRKQNALDFQNGLKEKVLLALDRTYSTLRNIKMKIKGQQNTTRASFLRRF